MKAFQYLTTAALLLVFTACSNLLGNEEILAEVEKQVNQSEGVGSTCGNIVRPSDTHPLYVIDGQKYVVHTDSLDVKPEEIKSIDIIKGKEAIKRYGSDARIGAVLITTKSKN